MPRLLKRIARKNLYKIGQRTPANNKQGFVLDRSKPNMNESNEFEQDELIIEKGEEYYTWHPKGQEWQYSKTKPDLSKPKSEWEEKFEDFQERVNLCQDVEGLEEDCDELVSEIEEYRDDLQSRLDNMPQQLQESSVLNERIEELQSLIDSI